MSYVSNYANYYKQCHVFVPFKSLLTNIETKSTSPIWLIAQNMWARYSISERKKKIGLFFHCILFLHIRISLIRQQNSLICCVICGFAPIFFFIIITFYRNIICEHRYFLKIALEYRIRGFVIAFSFCHCTSMLV